MDSLNRKMDSCRLEIYEDDYDNHLLGDLAKNLLNTIKKIIKKRNIVKKIKRTKVYRSDSPHIKEYYREIPDKIKREEKFADVTIKTKEAQ